MSFLDLGKTVLNAGKESLRDGLTGGLLKATGQQSMTGQVRYGEYEYDANGNIKGVNSKSVVDTQNKYGSSTNGITVDNEYDGNSNPGLGDAVMRKPHNTLDPEKLHKFDTDSWNKALAKLHENMKITPTQDEEYQGYSDEYLNSDYLKLKLPIWGYADFINERAIWQKQLGSIFDEPAWFYFKIFFDFNVGHGLFGSLLNSDTFLTGVNSAAKYLYYTKGMYKEERVTDKINALYKFTSILSYICTTAPWYFKGVSGLDKLSIPVTNEFSKERYIEIDLMPDAIDMRLTTLMSLYKYACWDDINHKEVIPENLRKFNMSIVVFQTPLRYLHTSYSTNEKTEFMGINVSGLAGGLGGKLLGQNKQNNKKFYKSISGVGSNKCYQPDDRMSFKIYTLYGCEFDMESFAHVMPNSMSNEEPFQLGKNSIKITYTFSTEHSMNEFYEIMYGTNGFYFNQYSNFQKLDGINSRKSKITGTMLDSNNEAHKKQLERYDALMNTFGNMTQGGTILGLINKPKSYKQAVDATEALMNGLFENNDLLGNLGTNFALGLLGSSKNTDAPQGNIYGDYGIGSAYFKDRLEMLKYGIHENTQTPYTYDEKGDPIYAKYRPANSYSTYDWNQTKQAINNFNLSNYIKNGVNSLANKANNGLRGLINGNVDNSLPNIPTKPSQSAKEFVKAPDRNYNPGVNSKNEYNKYQITPDTNSLVNSNKNNFENVNPKRTQAKFTYDESNAVKYESSKVKK